MLLLIQSSCSQSSFLLSFIFCIPSLPSWVISPIIMTLTTKDKNHQAYAFQWKPFPEFQTHISKSIDSSRHLTSNITHIIFFQYVFCCNYKWNQWRHYSTNSQGTNWCILYIFIISLLTDHQILQFRPKIYPTTVSHILVTFPPVPTFSLFNSKSPLSSLCFLHPRVPFVHHFLI